MRISQQLDINKLHANFPIFFSLTTYEFSRLLEKMVFHNLPKDTVIISEGGLSMSIFIINKGTVKVTIKGVDDREILLATLEKGDFFGEISLLTERPRTATVTSLEETELLELGAGDFNSYIRKYPLMHRIISDYCNQRMRHTANMLDSMKINRRIFPRLAIPLVHKGKVETHILLKSNITLSANNIGHLSSEPNELTGILQDISIMGARLQINNMNFNPKGIEASSLPFRSNRLKFIGSNVQLKISLPYNLGTIDTKGSVVWLAKAIADIEHLSDIGIHFTDYGLIRNEQFKMLVIKTFNLKQLSVTNIYSNEKDRIKMRELIPFKMILTNSICPIYIRDNEIWIGILNPLFLLVENRWLTNNLKGFNVKYFLLSANNLISLQKAIYPELTRIYNSLQTEGILFYTTNISIPEHESQKIKGLYDHYIMAKMECNEELKDIYPEPFFEYIVQNTNRIKRITKSNIVRYTVIIEGNKTRLMAHIN